MTLTPETPLTQDETIASLGTYGYGWSDSDVAGASAQRGLSEAVVRDISLLVNRDVALDQLPGQQNERPAARAVTRP